MRRLCLAVLSQVDSAVSRDRRSRRLPPRRPTPTSISAQIAPPHRAAAGSGYTYGFSPSMIPKGAYDFSAVAYHEISEVLGRITGLESSAPSFRSVMDLYRYTAPPKLAFNYWILSYLFLNGGVTNLQSLNVTGGGDLGVSRHLPVPGQQLVDLLGWVVGDAAEDVGKTGLGINTVHLGGYDQAVIAPTIRGKGGPRGMASARAYDVAVGRRRT